MARASIVRSQLVPLALAHLRDRGINTASLEATAGSAGEVRMELPALLAFYEECRARAGSPWLGVELAEGRPVGSLGLVEFFWRSSATMREGLATLAAHARLLNDVVRFELVETAREASFVQRLDTSAVGMGQVANEFFVVTLVREIRSLVSKDFAPRRARFAHPKPTDSLGRLHRAVGTKTIVWSDAATGIDFDASWLDARLVTADLSLATALQSHTTHWLPWVVEPAEIAFESRLLAALHGRVGKVVSVRSIAREIGLSSRTLQRHLAARGMTFHALADRVLAEHAGKLVASGALSTKQIADRLGYTSSPALVRAFRRWTGMTPTAWRDQQEREPEP